MSNTSTIFKDKTKIAKKLKSTAETLEEISKGLYIDADMLEMFNNHVQVDPDNELSLDLVKGFENRVKYDENAISKLVDKIKREINEYMEVGKDEI